MIWWLFPIIIYGGITYLIGILVSISYYFLVQEMITGKDKAIYLDGVAFHFSIADKYSFGHLSIYQRGKSKRRKWVTMFYFIRLVLRVIIFCKEERRR